MRLRDRVAVVTGAAGGLGAVYASAIASEGGSVVVVDVLDCEDAAHAIREQGHQAVAMQADLTAEEQVQRLVSDVIARFGRIDILVNNAGGAGNRLPRLRLRRLTAPTGTRSSPSTSPQPCSASSTLRRT